MPSPPVDGQGPIIFAGSPAFAVPSLRALLTAGHVPAAVLTRPDRPAGRGRRLAPGPVKALALEAGIPVLQPATLKDPAAQEPLRALEPSLLVVVAYGLILPPAVLALPARGCINVHASLLPRWRGASPIQAAILAGDAETGVSLMALEAGLDTGPVYATRATPIGPDESAGQLEARLAELGAALLIEHLPGILAGTAVATPQPAAGVTYAGRIEKSAGVVDWSAPAAEIQRRIRAFDPWPGAETLFRGERLRLWSAVVPPDDTAPAGVPGQVVATGPLGIDVRTGQGLLRLTSVQMPGRQRVSAPEFARGYRVSGDRLGPLSP